MVRTLENNYFWCTVNQNIYGIKIIFKSIQKILKKTWDGIKAIATLKSKDKTTPNSLIVNGNILQIKNSIAEIFNDFFC